MKSSRALNRIVIKSETHSVLFLLILGIISVTFINSYAEEIREVAEETGGDADIAGPVAVVTYQGFGAATPGGAGKPLYHVTSLANSGPGTLRNAVSQGNRIVVFDKAGIITLTSDIDVKGAYITIAGETAPAGGITLKNYGLRIHGSNGAHDIIVRHIRVRNAAIDGIQIAGGAYRIVVDHTSIYNSGDGNLDVTQNNTRHVTLSWNIVADPAGEEKNTLIANRARYISMHHNLYVKSAQRNPQVTYDDSAAKTQDAGTTLDMRNNIIWDWRGGYGTRIRYGAAVNIVNNFYSSNNGDEDDSIIICKGAATAALAHCDKNAENRARAYTAGNFSADELNLNKLGNSTNAFPAPVVTTQTACAAAKLVYSKAGVRPLDTTDKANLTGITINCT